MSSPNKNYREKLLLLLVIAFLCTSAYFGYQLYIQAHFLPGQNGPEKLLEHRADIVDVSQRANDFISDYLSFTAIQLEEHQRRLKGQMTPKYAKRYAMVWQDSRLENALRERKARVSVTLDPPAVHKIEEDTFYVNVYGRLQVESKITALASQERYVSATVVIVKTSEGYKVDDVLWRNSR